MSRTQDIRREMRRVWALHVLTRDEGMRAQANSFHQQWMVLDKELDKLKRGLRPDRGEWDE